jgi:hypothetical protein
VECQRDAGVAEAGAAACTSTGSKLVKTMAAAMAAERSGDVNRLKSIIGIEVKSKRETRFDKRSKRTL